MLDLGLRGCRFARRGWGRGLRKESFEGGRGKGGGVEGREARFRGEREMWRQEEKGRVVCMGGVACVRVGGVVRVKKVKGDLIELLVTSGEGGNFEAVLLELVFDAGSDGELEGRSPTLGHSASVPRLLFRLSSQLRTGSHSGGLPRIVLPGPFLSARTLFSCFFNSFDFQLSLSLVVPLDPFFEYPICCLTSSRSSNPGPGGRDLLNLWVGLGRFQGFFTRFASSTRVFAELPQVVLCHLAFEDFTAILPALEAFEACSFSSGDGAVPRGGNQRWQGTALTTP
ncbi:hypothetical protein BJ322DRAFT_1025822 [Thelephora terrestris]|uniref:Uncharacterized protein n=1 Tax=Thelephora terrestris TaxID=56493 RepID=A0A9P6H4J4_9AGAM|nr:hypothetical protein BJ322DRAFT_1025822 [Thelephora terrestris]